jgi:putative endonuclease
MLQLLLRLADLARHRARLRLWSPDQASGRRGEDLAHRFLRERGFQVIARNYRPRGGDGEIDLVCRDGAKLVFVEVKSRRSDEYGEPDRAIDDAKRKALIRSAREYARRAQADWEQVRFDVVNVVLGPPPVVSYVPAAFSGRGRT